MFQMTDGADVWVAFTTEAGAHHVYKTTVLVAAHGIVGGAGGGATPLHSFQTVHATEAEALAACAAQIRERARSLDAKADALTAKAASLGVGPAKPE